MTLSNRCCGISNSLGPNSSGIRLAATVTGCTLVQNSVCEFTSTGSQNPSGSRIPFRDLKIDPPMQVSIAQWHDVIGYGTLADAILDKQLQDAHTVSKRIESTCSTLSTPKQTK